ncbi:hypothetical protein [Pseudomonas sp.]|nr:hypothetical protein [Pseudomonas sp.]
MHRFPLSSPTCPPDPQARHCTWPSDTVLKRRRSVLFAFTFSPHLPRC